MWPTGTDTATEGNHSQSFAFSFQNASTSYFVEWEKVFPSPFATPRGYDSDCWLNRLEPTPNGNNEYSIWVPYFGNVDTVIPYTRTWLWADEKYRWFHVEHAPFRVKIHPLTTIGYAIPKAAPRRFASLLAETKITLIDTTQLDREGNPKVTNDSAHQFFCDVRLRRTCFRGK